MRVVQTRNKGLVFGMLLSAFVVGVLLTNGAGSSCRESTGDDSGGEKLAGPFRWTRPIRCGKRFLALWFR